MREEVQRLNKKKESVRREYLRIHNQNERKTRVQKVESIGDDLDYDVAFQCLKLEVEQLTNDVDFLKAAFGEEEDDEEYIFAGEEEETNDANKESNKDDATGYDLYDQAINKDNDENEEQNTLNDPEKQPEIKNSKIFMFSKDEDPAEEEAEYEEIIEEEEEEEEEANDLIDEEVDDE
ncbi:hypothetical protein TRFO_31892 [Tritrichomonas foetus]|uniref:Uncharacterized protein n=1 Tax=Tritrichomonas foetus TaxID=1144522 RepID=A0A1J4JQB1_9EUKA|nr:hypothetical protein TRFO_31892 [Tritrichomonas foetus]|eukprot:OHT01305.1 hypothetical protein TRFO_31892 [Tritrichomonas foetus]